MSYSRSQELVFRGAVLEGLNGKSLDKRLEEDPSFCDIDFLLTSLSQVRLRCSGKFKCGAVRCWGAGMKVLMLPGVLGEFQPCDMACLGMACLSELNYLTALRINVFGVCFSKRNMYRKHSSQQC